MKTVGRSAGALGIESVSLSPATGGPVYGTPRARLRRRTGMLAVGLWLLVAPATMAQAQAHPADTPADVMVQFLKAFEVHDYDTCRSLLVPSATITITRRTQGGAYESEHLSAFRWLDGVDSSGVHEIEGFRVTVLDTVTLEHTHGATATVRFRASGNTGRGVFTNNGFDTGSLIMTPAGWRILHYSSFEDFSWEADPSGR